MQFEVFEPDIEVNGTTVYAIVAGLGYFTNLSRRYFSQVHIGTVVNKELRVDKNGWYPQSAWLEAFKQISVQVGDRVLFNIGLSIPANAQFPPWVVDIDSAVRSVDVAYHLNHRKKGRLLFDVKTGVMSEGIGHYGYRRVSAERKIISVSHNPYPCAFDRGIITAMAHKFEPSALVVHDDTKECRSHGANTCTYIITW
ncbi:MAG: hypothetical protein LBJ41_00440 [Treponema sp.]|jgi:hypothetical protein|nr:hypothetical protein [Treponema sp.]